MTSAVFGSPAALRDAHVVVVGAGVGGLVSALLLAHRGVRVTVLEAAATPGGKMRQLHVDGAAIDAGPTVFTMRWVFDQIFEAAGTTLAAQLKLQALAVLGRHAWAGQTKTLDLFAERARSVDAIGAFSGAAEARRFVQFCAEAERVYRALLAPHIRSARPSLRSMAAGLGPSGLLTLASLGPFATMWGRLGRHFHDPRLQQLFGRYATYCGSSPWLAPATLMLVAQVELDGVWAVEGGMHALAQTLANLAQARGAELRYGQAVDQILLQGGQASGVRLADGSILTADAVVFNGDAQALASGLLGPQAKPAVKALPRGQRSLSAVTWAMHARASGFPLVRHNVFFDDDYASEFADVFQHRRLPQRGTVYVCAQDRADDGLVTRDHERILCLVNAPPDGDQNPFDPAETDPCEQRQRALLGRCGLTLTAAPHQVQRTTPHDFNRLFPATGGALYGPAAHGWMSVFRRPGATSQVPGLYLAGGSVHPGPGVPMAALSGQRAAETLMAHLDSTSRSRRVATSGGTSTPSVTTANTA